MSFDQLKKYCTGWCKISKSNVPEFGIIGYTSILALFESWPRVISDHVSNVAIFG